jgi:Fe-Mn family superoxide dismutase
VITLETKISRRSFGGIMGATALTLASARLGRAAGIGGGAITSEAAQQDAPDGPFTLPPLPYDYAALEPHIDTMTMQIHHDKHHAAYVANLNKAVADRADLQSMTALELIQNLDVVPEEIRPTVQNNAGGHVNHTMFWEIMGPAGSKPSGEVLTAIYAAFGSLDALKEQVNKGAMSRFGSGWSWVVLTSDGVLALTTTPYQDNPLTTNAGTPILGVDVWEHAYYLKYQNKRADYLDSWWNVLNWDAINARYLEAGGK